MVRLIKNSVAFGTLIGSVIIIQDYDPSHRRALNLAVLDEERSNLDRETDSLLPVYLCKLAELAQTGQNETVVKITVRGPQTIRRHQNSTDAAAKARIASLLDTLHITRVLEDPPPQLFLAACLLFAFAVATLQHWHKADKYLNRILVLGMMIGCAAAFQTTNALMALKSYLAWSALLALLLSDLAHWAIGLGQDHQQLDDAPEMGLQLPKTKYDQRNGEK